jgi:hypothetical protein
MDTANRGNLSAQVAAEVRAELGRQRKTATELGAQLGLSVQSASRRLSGTGDFSLDEVELICGWLGLDVVDLMSRSRAVA